jgi:hypothetical protein
MHLGVFLCPNGFFNFGSKCLKLFEMNPTVKMTYKDASQFCHLNNLELFTTNAIYDLRHESLRHGSYLVFANSSSQIESLENLSCIDLRTIYMSITECEKPFTLICYKNRGNIIIKIDN